MTELGQINLPVQNTISYNDVYFVQGKLKLGKLDPIAISPKIFQDTVEWHNTNRLRSMPCSKITVSPDNKTIEITTTADEKITLTALTATLFKEKVKSKVSGKLDFKTDEELKKYYLNFEFAAL